MPNSLTIPLDPPVSHAGGRIEAVTLREPTAKEAMECDLKRTEAGGPAGFRAYRFAQVAMASGLSVAALCDLPISCFNKAAAFVGTLLDLRDDAPVDAPPTLTVALDPPVVSGGVTYSALDLQEPTAGQVWRAEQGLNGGRDVAALRNFQAVLVAGVSGIPYAAVCEMPVSIVSQAAAYCLGFTMPRPPAGGS